MGNCGSTNNKRDNQKNKSKQPEQSSPSKSRAQPSKEREREANTQQSQLKEQTKLKPLKVIAIEDGNTRLNKEYERDTKVETVYNDLHLDSTKDYEITYNNKPINVNGSSKIQDIFNSNTDAIELTITYNGLDIADNCRESYATTTQKIGTVLLDNKEIFNLIVYDTVSQQPSSYTYSLDKDDILKSFGAFSSFCNAKNKLYLSGGEVPDSNNEYIAKMVVIDLETSNKDTVSVEQLADLKEARTWHSMIYVPDKMIFIVGGHDSQTVEKYDILQNTISIDSKMNEKRGECTLCLFNNTYLYAFCGFILHQSYLTTIERCNLRRNKREWEMVDIEYENNITFDPTFFAVSYYKNDILLLGGNERSDEKDKNYIVTIPQPEQAKIVIKEYNSFENIANIYREKFFLPINQDESILLPVVSSDVKVFTMHDTDGKIKMNAYNIIEDSNRY